METQQYTINRTEVLRYLGYGGQSLTPELDAQIDRMIEECARVSRPVFFYDLFDLERTDGDLYLRGTTIRLSGEDIKQHLRDARSCYILGATLGAGLEKELRKYEHSDLTGAVILHSAGTALIEEVCRVCEQKIREEIVAKGKYATFRFSPGYGDFPIETQKHLIPALQMEKRIGVTVTDRCLMIPRKSVTALIGVCDRKQSEAGPACRMCKLRKHCEMRKRGVYCGRE